MIKRVIEQIFQDHAADSLRKTLAEVERAASGRLHNESLCDYVTRLASFKDDAERRIAALAEDRSLMDKWHSISLENGREPDELMGDYIVRIWTSLDVAQRFAEDQKEKLQAANKRIDYLLCEPDASVQTLRDLEATANDNGRKPDEAVREFMTRTVAELTHAQTAIRLIQNRAYIYNCKKDEPVIDFLSRMNGTINELRQRVRECDDAAEKNGCGRTEETAKFIARLAAEMKELKQTITEKNATIGKLHGTHADDIGRIDWLAAKLAEIESEATECGRNEGESVPTFMSRLVTDLGDERASSMAMSKALAESKEDVARERERGNRINAEYEADMKKIMTTANELGRADYEAPDAFMKRQDSAITDLKADVIKVYGLADTLGRTSSESIPDFMKRQNAELDSATNQTSEGAKRLELFRQEAQDKAAANHKLRQWHEENLQKIRELEGDNARLQSAIKEACDIASANGRTESESLGWFIDRICAESKRKDQTVARLQKVLTAIHDAAKSGGLKQGEKIGAFIERLNEDLYKVRCDAASESMKMVNSNKRLQHAYDEADEERKVSKRFHALAVEERNNAQEEVHKMSAELAKETRRLRAYEDDHAQIYALSAAAGMQGNESVNQCLERKLAELSTVTADSDRIRAELADILAEANKSGRCNGDPVQLLKAGQNDLDARIAAEREAEDIKKRWRALNEHAVLKGMRGDETTAEFITRQQRLAADRQTELDRASGTIEKLTLDLTSAIVDKALAGNGAKEISRLSALVAELQVEIDDAKSKYGGIMAQLGNETPLQLIERMQRLAQDPRASTIPHDERAILVGEIADLRKRLEESQKAHAKAEHELTDARNGANECGMQSGERLRAFIYRKRAELLDALHASDRIQLLANENVDKLRAALATVESQSAAVEASAKLKKWASTIRHKVLVQVVHDKAMAEYDNIMKELHAAKVPQ